jgi:hypothetical protein
VASDEDVESGAYIRLERSAEAEATSLIVQALEDRGVPVLDTVDKPPLDGPFPQLLVVTGSAPRAVLARAVETLDSLQPVRAIRCVMDRLDIA